MFERCSLDYRLKCDQVDFVCGLFSDSGFGGISTSASKGVDYDGVESPRKLDLDGLTPFEKNFYVESSAVAAMSESDVDEYRLMREITVEGQDVPKPVKSFRDVRFPGTLFLLNSLAVVDNLER